MQKLQISPERDFIMSRVSADLCCHGNVCLCTTTGRKKTKQRHHVLNEKPSGASAVNVAVFTVHSRVHPAADVLSVTFIKSFSSDRLSPRRHLFPPTF